MAQGREWTTEERETIIQSLKPYLEMGYSRNKACAFVGIAPGTLSNWVKADDALGIKLTSWENMLTGLALATVHQAIQNEKLMAEEKGEVRTDNSWKYLSKREDGYKDKLDVTTNDKELPAPIISLDAIRRDNSPQTNSQPRQED